MWSIDARIPLVFGSVADGAVGRAFLVEGGLAVPPGAPVARFVPPQVGHAAGCACCVPRGPVAVALDGLFLARTRSACGWFTSTVAVVSTQAGRTAILAALEADAVVSARFRLGP